MGDFSELLAFDPLRVRREKLSLKSPKITTIKQFVFNDSACNERQHLYRIYGWISRIRDKSFNVIDGSGELRGLKFDAFMKEIKNSNDDFLFELVCLDLKITKNLQLKVVNCSLMGMEVRRRRPSTANNDKTEEQVHLDVQRAFCFEKGIAGLVQEDTKRHLKRLILAIMNRNPSFRYYQGFHDICAMFLLSSDEDISRIIQAAEQFSRKNLR